MSYRVDRLSPSQNIFEVDKYFCHSEIMKKKVKLCQNILPLCNIILFDLNIKYVYDDIANK